MEREGGFRVEPTMVHFLWAQKASLRHLAAYKCNSACSRDMTCAFSYLRFQGHILAKSTAFALQCNGRKPQWLFWEQGQKGSCFFSNSFSVLPTNEQVSRKKKKKHCDFVSLLIYKAERLRKLPVYLLYLKQQFLVGVYFFLIVNFKINKGIPTNYCLCSCGGKINQIPYINITSSNLLAFWRFGSKKPVKELSFFFSPSVYLDRWSMRNIFPQNKILKINECVCQILKHRENQTQTLQV